ncbi:hypothetical protein QQP08_011059 [Theobroma cacao]|nr:hypothetical protein QQP08_011059 [Theobroma cacao]
MEERIERRNFTARKAFICARESDFQSNLARLGMKSEIFGFPNITRSSDTAARNSALVPAPLFL